MEQINFAGGEPLLYRSYFDFLETAIDEGFAAQIHLSFNTNLTQIPDQLLCWIMNFKRVSLDVSIDAIGDLNNFIRYPSRWEKVSANYESMLQLASRWPNLHVDITTAVSAYNVLHLNEQ